MAFMNQERKSKLAPSIKQVLKKYRVKGTISTDRCSLSVNIKSGPMDFISDYNQTVATNYPNDYRNAPAKGSMMINEYWYRDHFSDTKIKDFIGELIQAMNEGNHDNSRAEVDYFDVGWYTHINIGKWNKPYEVTP